ncbi:acetyl coenzyme A synthetase (ADP forming)-like protein [Methanomicrobium sp. W14]|uniref:acetate--CoA ligase family protein n=1 Tax=Methanomicrobium sp. W14 TaxID=2817839 RepID=UPI001AE376CC|nr:acetate--CoA ligase family protein [Methanomicrobium sp. W14]MBP2134149.1 acetyl coenzyme A synthetase (ADP forming)-like protein [Methanomicrobium sp. W14]
MPETKAYSLLKKAGISVPCYFFAKNKKEVIDAAKKIPYPATLKISSPDISHKSDAGGVVLDIPDESALIREYESLLKRVKKNAGKARINGVMISEQVPSGTEVLIGGVTDPSFGRVMSFGKGGTEVELWKDVSFRLVPLDRERVRSMIDETKISAIIKGFRGLRPLDIDALTGTILKISEIFESDESIVSFDINPVILSETKAVCVDARFITDSSMKKKAPETYGSEIPKDLFMPETIAVAGASPVPGKVGYYVMQNLLEFKGEVVPVNPGRDMVLGRKAFKKVSDIKKTPDWVIICVPARKVNEIVSDAGKSGVKFCVIISAGFKETGEKGEALEKEVLETARKYNMRITGPNSLGIMIPGIGLNATFGPALPKKGPVAFISQSGAIISAVADRSITGDVGISSVISVGNQADLKFSDYVDMLSGDNRTKAAVLYIEEIVRGREFLKRAGRTIKDLPMVAIKSGRSAKGTEAARSHTGSLAGSWEIYREAFMETGIVMAYSVTRAFQTAGLLASEGWPKGNRAVVITSAGGFAVLSADYAEDNGIVLIDLSDEIKYELDKILPFGWSGKNPIDMVGDAGSKRYAETLDVLMKHDNEWDIAFVAAAPVTSIEPVRLAKEIVRFSSQTKNMVIGCLIGGDSMMQGIRVLNEAHVPNFSELADAFSSAGDCIKAAGKLKIFSENNTPGK